MKKLYSKPEIMFESFAMNVNIAGDCEVKTNNPSSSACALDFSGVAVFLNSVPNICTGVAVEAVGGDGEYNGICYYTVTGGNNVFSS